MIVSVIHAKYAISNTKIQHVFDLTLCGKGKHFMISGTYKVLIKSPLGNLNGTMSLRTAGNMVSGTLSLFGVENHFSGQVLDETSYSFSGEIRTPMGLQQYSGSSHLTESGLTATAKMKAGTIEIIGSLI